MSAPLPKLSATELARYSRHILLDEIGIEGQQVLKAARVLVVGAGGLGSPAALYLAAAGIGTLGIADLDCVEEHNLQRQLLHDTPSIGKAKIASAAERIRTLNPHVKVLEHGDGITSDNATEVFANYDVIVDGTDNFTARYVNNDAAFQTRKPLVFGSVFKFEGQVAVFDPARGGPCYRCLFPEPPAAGSVPGCGEAGVVGALCGVIGSLQAMEAIKLILSIGESLVGRLLTYDSLRQQFQTLRLSRSPTCRLCGDNASTAVEESSGSQTIVETPSEGAENDYPLEISVLEANKLRVAKPEKTILLDVREPWETEICRVEGATFIPMRQIPENVGSLSDKAHVLVLCHHGSRSRTVTKFLRSHGLAAVSNISGGIAAWADQVDPTLARY